MKKGKVFTISREDIKCICEKKILNHTKIECKSCRKSQHLDCVGEASAMETYECPNCQVSKMDFKLKIFQKLLNPSLIAYSQKNSKSTFTFKLNKETYNKARFSQNVSLFIRCLRLDKNGYEHHWPLNCSVIINKNKQFSLEYLKFPLRKAREDFPLIFNFNEKLKYYKQDQYKLDEMFIIGLNTIEINVYYEKNDDDKFNYALSVDFVQYFDNIEEIIDSIPVDNDNRFLKSKFIENETSILVNQTLTLRDLYNSSSYIELPARSIDCSHIQVFDLKNYLLMNSVSKIWNCPICKKKSLRLYIDGTLYKLIKESDEKLSEIVFNYETFSFRKLIKTQEIKSHQEVISLEEELEKNPKEKIEKQEIKQNYNQQIVYLDNSEEFDSMSTSVSLQKDLKYQYELATNENDYIKKLMEYNTHLMNQLSKTGLDKQSIVITTTVDFKESSLLKQKRKEFLYLD